MVGNAKKFQAIILNRQNESDDFCSLTINHTNKIILDDCGNTFAYIAVTSRYGNNSLQVLVAHI